MNANENIQVNRKYKDTIFRKLFGENKENALSLYNAVNGTSYTDADELEFTTLEDAVKKSVDDCIKNNVLKDFLEMHRKEVVDMCLTEFDETKWGQLREYEGLQKGVFSLVKKGKITVEDAAEELGLDVPTTEKLLADNGIRVPSVV